MFWGPLLYVWALLRRRGEEVGMDEYFWYLADEPSDRRVSDAVRHAESAPRSEPMRPSQRTRTPSTDRKKRMRRSAVGASEEVDWDTIHPRIKGEEIHRGLGLNLPDELHHAVHGNELGGHERALTLLNHIAAHPEHYGLGVHWSLDNNQAEQFATQNAEHYADHNKDPENSHDFSWGRNKGDVDYGAVHEHLENDHGVSRYYHPASNEGVADFHERLHRGIQVPGQQALFPEPPHDPSKRKHLDLEDFRAPDEPKGKPGTAVVLHSTVPDRENIFEDHHSTMGYGDIYHPEGHGEAEIPVRPGTSMPIHGISWKKEHSWEDSIDDEPTWNHVNFHDHEHREAAKTATVLNTQVERLNKGDQIRTPTGQVAEVTSKPRPHETDSGKVYIDTDMGTTLADRGTDFQVVPRNSQQQELPDVGNVAGGNFAQLPGSGNTPGGPGTSKLPGANQAMSHAACPNCGNTGTLSLHGNQFVCSVCGFQIAAGGSPGGLTFTNWPSGVMPPRKKPGEVPKAHVWASRNATLRDEGNVIARRARQVLDKEDM